MLDAEAKRQAEIEELKLRGIEKKMETVEPSPPSRVGDRTPRPADL